MKHRVAADIGGTFTDIAYLAEDGTLATRKMLSTPPNYGDAVVAGLLELAAELGLGLDAFAEVLHGCTVAANTILEHKGAKTALLTTEGFRDVLELRRIRTPRLYAPLYRKPPPLVPRRLRFEVGERIDAQGGVVRPLATDDVHRAIARMKSEGVEAVAVCLLHSYINPTHEQAIGAILRDALPDCFISLSIDVLPQMREYERTSTTVVNAYIGPPVRNYLNAMIDQLAAAGAEGRLMIMLSSGGILDARNVLDEPAQIVECGPAAGVVGAAHLAAENDYGNVITFDMGGTTAKASIIEEGKLVIADEYEVGGGMSSTSKLVGGGGYAVGMPVIDISEVGAGGGSIVWLDKAGSIKVGPQSAGAVPGPACYPGGGSEPTVTDANVVLGYLNPLALAGGTVAIDAARAQAVIETRLAAALRMAPLETAYGVHTVANANMIRAIKGVTTYRGRNPRGFRFARLWRQRWCPRGRPCPRAPDRAGHRAASGRGVQCRRPAPGGSRAQSQPCVSLSGCGAGPAQCRAHLPGARSGDRHADRSRSVRNDLPAAGRHALHRASVGADSGAARWSARRRGTRRTRARL